MQPPEDDIEAESFVALDWPAICEQVRFPGQPITMPCAQRVAEIALEHVWPVVCDIVSSMFRALVSRLRHLRRHRWERRPSSAMGCPSAARSGNQRSCWNRRARLRRRSSGESSTSAIVSGTRSDLIKSEFRAQ